MFAPVNEVDWLAADEPVMGLVHDGDVRIHPTQVLVWHEIVNDVVGSTPVSVTHCSLCNSGLAFVREVAGEAAESGRQGRSSSRTS